MKQFYLLLTASLFAFATIAENPNDFEIKKFADGEAPVLNGEMDAIWSGVDPLVVEECDISSFGGAEVRLAWNDTALFVFMDAVNNPFQDQWVTGEEDWQSDRGELFFNVSDEIETPANPELPNGGHEAGAYQITTDWQREGLNDTIVYEDTGYGTGDANIYHFAYVIDRVTGEWQFELAVPWGSLNYFDADADEDVEMEGVAGEDFWLQVGGVGTGPSPDFDIENYSLYPGVSAWDDGFHWVGDGNGDKVEEENDAAKVTLSADVVVESTTSVANVQAVDVSVYPNPANDNISVNLLEDGDVSIINVTGSVVKEVSNTNGQNIDISSLPAGVYFIKADDFVGKFIKK